MKYIFFDLETTGLNRDCDILEFGALVFDENIQLIDVINQYYRCDNIPASATEVHGLTPIKLQMFNAIEWDDDVERIHRLVAGNDVVLCGHNIISYDLPVLQSNFERSGINWDFKSYKTLDTMREYSERYSGSKKLSSAFSTAAFKLNSRVSDIQELFKSTDTIANKIVDKSAFFHNALFDAYCSFVIFFALLR